MSVSTERKELKARLSMLSYDEIDPELREMLEEIDPQMRDRPANVIGPMLIQAHRPGLAKAFIEYHNVLRTDRLLSDRLHELVRLRIAFFSQCRSCMAVRFPDGLEDGVTEDLVCSLERPEDAPDLTDAERAALRYAELMATDHLAIDAAVYDDLRRHFTEPEIVELATRVAYTVGFTRMTATFNVIEHLPERFQQDGTVTPWGPDAVTLR